ncbi:hypothetical protein CTheo_8741 [Ceratobasidium theobromae]|uniref:Uncharacterized protein n=1 Tax=Ceratobasidium theobromae TaxID=1582974 RepID=A0A5N5Q8T9_9AGAM|nr:hypothetical protein CTheo_8741 [Ceratobasidium theobromae]
MTAPRWGTAVKPARRSGLISVTRDSALAKGMVWCTQLIRLAKVSYGASPPTVRKMYDSSAPVSPKEKGTCPCQKRPPPIKASADGSITGTCLSEAATLYQGNARQYAVGWTRSTGP